MLDRTRTTTLSAPSRYALALYYGRRLVATVVPDDIYSGMWHVVLPNGWRSDMVNISRAKDAAHGIAEKWTGDRHASRYTWKKYSHRRPSEAPPVRQNGSTLVREPSPGQTHQRTPQEILCT